MRSTPRGPDVIVYGGSSWDSPWLTEHHLARALARRCRVLFVDSPTSLAAPLRATSVGGAASAARRIVRDGVRATEGLHVVRLLALPPVSSERMREIAAPWLRRQVERAVRELGMRPEVVVAARSPNEGLPRGTRAVRVSIVKDWLQAGGHLTGLDEQALRERELRAWRQADLVVATSSRLQERLGQDQVPSRLLRHGYDTTLPAPGPLPTALADLPAPRIGCLGRIDGRWAFGPLTSLAERRQDASIVLVGPVSAMAPQAALDALLARPNVHVLPAVPSLDAQTWLAGLDCQLIPYLADDWQHYASPLKIWDYLAAGAPIAATGSPAMGEFPEGLVNYAEDPASLPDLVEDALQRDSPDLRRRRREHAAANSWDSRAEALLAMVDEIGGAR